MTITREIVIDLLPLYAAGEASADTRRLVDEFIGQDPSVAALLRALQHDQPERAAPGEPPPALERTAVNRTRAMVQRRGWTMGLAILFTLLPLTFAFKGGEIEFFMLRDQPESALFWLSAAFLWWRHVTLTRALRATGV
jgi:anti-sigma factor RsiW